MVAMRVMVFAAGSRGDVQPLVALALGLQRAGHDVVVAAARDFGPFVEAQGLSFHGFSADVRDLLDSDLGRSWLGHSSHRPMLELKLLTKMVDTWGLALVGEVLELAGSADLFVSGVLTIDGTDALVRARGGRHAVALMAPFAPTRAGWAGVQASRPLAFSRANLVSGQVMNWFLAGAFSAPGREIRRRLGVAQPSRRRLARLYADTPTVVGVSPAVVPQPQDWPPHLQVTGYWFLDAAADWTPNAALQAFLDNGEPPVYVGFGSMSTHDTDGTMATILEAVGRAGVRAVVHRGAAGLAATDLPAEVHIVDDVPHDWLFPRCVAVVHHGGAGTTAAGLRAGRPSGIVAHIGDQPFWGRRVHELGVGAPPLRRHQASAEALGRMVETLVATPVMAARAAELGAVIRAEDGVGRAVEHLERHVGEG
jgi:UDP:flavonoid glycosyltransferase YjiC (YdhE family)